MISVDGLMSLMVIGFALVAPILKKKLKLPKGQTPQRQTSESQASERTPTPTPQHRGITAQLYTPREAPLPKAVLPKLTPQEAVPQEATLQEATLQVKSEVATTSKERVLPVSSKPQVRVAPPLSPVKKEPQGKTLNHLLQKYTPEQAMVLLSAIIERPE